MRIVHKIEIVVSQDTDQKIVMFQKAYPEAEVVIDRYQKPAVGELMIPADEGEGSSEDIPFGDIEAVYGLYLEVDQVCELTLNGADTPIVLTPPGTAAGTKAKFFIEGVIEHASIAAGDEAVHGIYVVWGDLPETP